MNGYILLLPVLQVFHPQVIKLLYLFMSLIICQILLILLWQIIRVVLSVVLRVFLIQGGAVALAGSVLGSALAWTFLLASALKKNWLLRSARKEPLSGADLLLALWALSIFILFSMSATKLPHYMFPVLPALACLVGKYVSEDPQREKNAWKICGGTLIFFLALIHFVLPAVDRYRVMKPIGVALKENAPADAKVYGYFVSEPSLFFYGGRLFPLIEEGTLDDLLSQKGPVFVITKESRFHDVPASVPHKTLARADGFSENGGKMTLRLLSNERP